jgi:hypothetical protein
VQLDGMSRCVRGPTATHQRRLVRWPPTSQTAFAYTAKEAEPKAGLQAVTDAIRLLPEQTSIGITIAKVAALLILVVVRALGPRPRNPQRWWLDSGPRGQ